MLIACLFVAGVVCVVIGLGYLMLDDVNSHLDYGP